MMTFLKRQIGNLLTSGPLHRLLVKPAIKDGFLVTGLGDICVKNQSAYLQSLIHFQIYERSEVSLIREYIQPGIPVIEFGASLGMTSLAICSKVNKQVPVISVEANPRLYANLSETKKKNTLSNLTLVSAAVDYSGAGSISFILDDSNLGSHIGESKNSVSVPTITLSQVLQENKIEQFALVCDIEGAEVDLFLNETDQHVIDNCTLIIIELHQVIYQGRQFTREEINDIITEKFCMKKVFSDGKSWVYTRQDAVCKSVI